MAEIQTSGSTSRKGTSKPDMTPMVDLGFLLLTFFIFTTTFSKPNVMKLFMPEKNGEASDMLAKNTLTIVLGSDNRIFWYQKPLDEVTEDDLVETTYAAEGIRNEILKKYIAAIDTAKFTVIIKPTDSATFENAVDILDEMEITGSKRFSIVDLSSVEQLAYSKRLEK